MTSLSEPIIQLQHVAFAFGSTPIHRDISLSIYPGEIVTLMGPSGTGKTVLLKLMIGLYLAKSGDVTVLGRNLAQLSENELRDIRRSVGILFQGAALFDSICVGENIAFPLREHGEEDEEVIRGRVDELLTLVGLPEVRQKLPGQLSGGQKKRIGLARALALAPRVLLFDEPTTGLDPTSKRQIDDLIYRLKIEQQVTSVLVTHDMDSAYKLSDRLLLIDEGTIKVEGQASQLWNHNKAVQAFRDGVYS